MKRLNLYVYGYISSGNIIGNETDNTEDFEDILFENIFVTMMCDNFDEITDSSNRNIEKLKHKTTVHTVVLYKVALNLKPYITFSLDVGTFRWKN